MLKEDKWRSKSTEDFLKAVYKLESEKGIALTVELSKMLSITPPSATDVVKRMAAEVPPLVEHYPYKGVKLTERGRRAALQIVRRHRLIETLLSDLLDYDVKEIHQDAERLEHAVSDLFIEKLAKKLGDPEFDPHGEPIPSSKGKIPKKTENLVKV